MAETLPELFHCMWRKEAIPQEYKGCIIHIYKRKRNSRVCENRKGIKNILEPRHEKTCLRGL